MIISGYNESQSSTESRTMSESAKVVEMNKQMGQAYSGVWQLPSGNPGLTASTDDIEVVVVGDEEGIQIILTDGEDDTYMKVYDPKDEAKAVADFKKLAGDLSDLVSGSKLAKKYGLREG